MNGESHRRASVIEAPGMAECHAELGNFLWRQARLPEAAVVLRRAIRCAPAEASHSNGLGNIFKDCGQLGVAEHCYRRSIVLAPDRVEPLFNRATVLWEQGRQDEGQAALTRAGGLRPDQPQVAMSLVLHRLYLPACQPGELLISARKWCAIFAAKSLPIDKNHQELRRLGFVSGDFHSHAVAYLVIPTIEALRRRGYHLICYSNSAIEDGMTRRYRAAAHQWRQIDAMTDDEVVAQISGDGIDVLFDLSGFTGRSRLALFARKPAPLQIAWAGYPGTTGLGAMDYILADRHQLPLEAEAWYTEKSLRPADNYIAFEPPADTPEPGPLPALANGRITFGSFNSLKKISQPVLALWVRILERLPEARLIMKTPALSCAATRGLVTKRFAAAGIAAERLALLGASTPAAHRAAMAAADIALDSFPYSGGVTTLEALWMGLPVITLPGETFASRHSLGYLATLGLQELVAADAEDYVRKAVELATDTERLDALRSGLRRRMANSPLTDVEGFADRLSASLEGLWQTRQLPFDAALAMHHDGRLFSASIMYRHILAIDPGHADALHMLGLACHQQGDPARAARLLSTAANIWPRTAEIHANLGAVLKALGRLDEALASLSRALQLQPDNADTLITLGETRRLTGHRSAGAILRRALALAPAAAKAHNNLGVLVQTGGAPRQAMTFLSRACASCPDLADAFNNIGICLQEERQMEAAEQWLRAALALQPGLPIARWNLSVLLLGQGRLAEGWRYYEARCELEEPVSRRPDLPFPQWRGEELRGKSVLIWFEQGFGDQIQFCRCASLLKRSGAKRITLVCVPELLALFQSLAGVDCLVPTNCQTDLPVHDFWTFPLSIPHYLQTTLATIPAELPYLSPPPGRIEEWRRRHPPQGFTIGLVWRGNPAHHNDRHRSLPGLATLAPLWSIPGVTFVSLQSGATEADSPPPGQPLLALGGRIGDFADTAAIVSQLDLVISVDTSVVHLAGALGRPCWLLLTAVRPDWRWLEDRTDSPWYPQVLRIFRQDEADNWATVVERVSAALKEHMEDSPQ